MAVVQCLASCGGLVRGRILGSEKLVSCPVEWYSTVEVTPGLLLTDERPFSRAMAKRLLLHWQYPAQMSQGIRIDVRSTIPVAKGTANSTADIAATAITMAQYLGHQLDESALAQFCVSLEPTDSAAFRQLTLPDHNDASMQITCEVQPQLGLLVLESPETLLTTDYHHMPHQSGLLASAPALKRAWEKVQGAYISQNLYRMGEAAALSAIASQLLLPKPNFDSLSALVEECDLYGASVVYSDSVVGLMLDRKCHDVDYTKWMLTQKKLTEHWPEQHLLWMVTGGVELQ